MGRVGLLARLAGLAGLLTLAVILAACSSDPDEEARVEAGGATDPVVGADGQGSGQETSPVDADELQGPTWTLRTGTGPSGSIPLVDGWPVTLVFRSDGFGGTAACNGYGYGTYTIVGDEFRFDVGGHTNMGCGDEIQRSEAAYLEAMDDVDRIGRRGEELVLWGPSTELVFTASPPVPLIELTGQLWLLESMVIDDEQVLPRGEPVTLLLDTDGVSFTGSTGCRTLTGRYVVSGSEVHVNEMSADGDCPTELHRQDGHVVEVLGDGFTPSLDGELLILVSAGSQELRYRATTPDEVASLPNDEVASDAQLLDGVEWVFAGGDTADGAIVDPATIDPETTITLSFVDGTYRGVAGCAPYAGVAELDESLWSFALGPVDVEEVDCLGGLDDEVGAAIDAYLGVIAATIEGGLQRDGEELVLNDGVGVELLFRRVTAETD